MFTSCHQRRSNAEAAIATFADLDRDLYHPIILLGSMEIIPEERTPLSFAYDGQELRVPVPDVYEDLHRKLFYAYMILDLLTQPAMVIKLDDDVDRMIEVMQQNHDSVEVKDLSKKLEMGGSSSSDSDEVGMEEQTLNAELTMYMAVSSFRTVQRIRAVRNTRPAQ